MEIARLLEPISKELINAKSISKKGYKLNCWRNDISPIILTDGENKKDLVLPIRLKN